MEFAARCIPVWEVGGDLYDVFKTDDGETAFVLGDVSGKGLPAALLMGLVQGAVRASCAGDAAQRCQRIAGQLNRLLCAKTARERFVTLFCCTFDERTSILRYVNAGHCPPVLVRGQDTILRLDAGGPVLGMLAAARYESGQIRVEAGDLLVVYSDGIVEASDAHDQEFGEERLIAEIGRNWRKPPAEICESILASTNDFLGSEAPQDDQTLLIVRLEPQTDAEKSPRRNHTTVTAAAYR
jgi:sigma-B regulation protein RsbU (phosphoserine phosphatase)